MQSREEEEEEEEEGHKRFSVRPGRLRLDCASRHWRIPLPWVTFDVSFNQWCVHSSTSGVCVGNPHALSSSSDGTGWRPLVLAPRVECVRGLCSHVDTPIPGRYPADTRVL